MTLPNTNMNKQKQRYGPKGKPKFSQSKVLEIEKETGPKAYARYELLLKNIKQKHKQSAKIDIPILYGLLRASGMSPDDARAQLEEDLTFYNKDYLREFLPDEAIQTQHDTSSKRNYAKEDKEKRIAEQQEFYDNMDNDKNELVDGEALGEQLEEQNTDASIPTLVFDKDEKAILSHDKLTFRPFDLGYYLIQKSNGFDAMLRNHPEFNGEIIESCKLPHDGTRITDIEIEVSTKQT